MAPCATASIETVVDTGRYPLSAPSGAAWSAALSGEGDHLVRRLQLRPGDLQLFRGRHSMHRVTAVEGQRERHSAISAFSAQRGVGGTVARTKQLFGRVLPAHLAAAGAGRGDQLRD